MSLPALTFECYQMESGVWCKRRDNGLRGACVADEAILWQHLQAAQAALSQKPPPTLDLAVLVKENEEISAAYEQLLTKYESLEADWIALGKDAEALRMRCEEWRREVDRLVTENLRLQSTQRKKPGRKPRCSDAAGAEEQALPAIEGDPLDEDL